MARHAVHPAINLYRSILRAHKKLLPSHMRSLGNAYLRSEFKAHKAADSAQTNMFLQSWSSYLESLYEGQHERSLSPKELAQLSDDQLGKLNEIREESTKVAASPSPPSAVNSNQNHH
mmetsp:Transcript_37678/g.65920  ORF Transcript_37678/g.65920 Transcript_37678/m.65920 type:complete len:118 (-) Transcript_37678:288-641(-)